MRASVSVTLCDSSNDDVKFVGVVGARSRVPDSDRSSSEDDDSDSNADDNVPWTACGMSTCQGRWDPRCFEVWSPTGDA